MQKYSDIILKIQEYADKTLQFGCIVDIYWVYEVCPRYVRLVDYLDQNEYNLAIWDNFKEFISHTVTEQSNRIIGLPMDMNRVNYLYLFYQNFCKEITEDVKLTMQYNYYHITAALEKNPNLYNLNIFDRHEEFVKLVYDMLRAAPIIQKD